MIWNKWSNLIWKRDVSHEWWHSLKPARCADPSIHRQNIERKYSQTAQPAAPVNGCSRPQKKVFPFSFYFFFKENKNPNFCGLIRLGNGTDAAVLFAPHTQKWAQQPHYFLRICSSTLFLWQSLKGSTNVPRLVPLFDFSHTFRLIF